MARRKIMYTALDYHNQKVKSSRAVLTSTLYFIIIPHEHIGRPNMRNVCVRQTRPLANATSVRTLLIATGYWHSSSSKNRCSARNQKGTSRCVSFHIRFSFSSILYVNFRLMTVHIWLCPPVMCIFHKWKKLAKQNSFMTVIFRVLRSSIRLYEKNG